MKLADFFSSFKSMWGAAAVAAGAGPLGLWVADLQPPWPASVGKVAALFCAVAMLVSFFVGPAGREADGGSASALKARRRRGRAVGLTLLLLGALGVGGYLWAYDRYVVQDAIDRGGRTEIIRTVIGTELRPGLGDTAGATNLDLLRDGLYEPERVWTPESVKAARQLLMVSFVLSFVLLTAGAAWLAQLEKPAEPAAPAPPKG